MKFIFNNEGFLALQGELYGLSDSTLRLESELVLHDFTSWVRKHFLLSTAQLKLITSMDDCAKKMLSFDTSFALENRLPINLTESQYAKEIGPTNIDWHQCTLSSRITSYDAAGTLQLSLD